MSLSITCPHCGKRLKAPENLAGRRVACPGCQGVVAVAAVGASNASATECSTTATPQPTSQPAEKVGGTKSETLLAACPQCAKKLKVPQALVGQRVRCPACQAAVTIPAIPATSPLASKSVAAPAAAPTASTAAIDDELFSLLNEGSPRGAGGLSSQGEDATEPPIARRNAPRPPASASPGPPAQPGKTAKSASFNSPMTSPSAALDRSGKPRFLYLLFALTLVPLGLQTLTDNKDAEAEFENRLVQSFSAHPEIKEQITDETTFDELFAMLPEHRLAGAHLPHETWVHWGYGLAAATAFLLLARLLFEPGRSTVVKLLLAAAVTGTLGIVSLLLFQFIAEATQGVWVRGRGVVTLLFYIVKFIGYSYRAASDPENGFALSMLGFTCGVGLCEELTKVLSALGVLGQSSRNDWRAACALGLASGVGFGVAEGIMYSGDMYNGISYGDIYLVRFISCVALHAAWSAAGTIWAAKNWSENQTQEISEIVAASLLAIAGPMVLHGLYDTLLKRDMPGYALVVAAASFAWLAIVVERARGTDEPVRTGSFPATASPQG